MKALGYEGKRVVVTGAASGMGEAAARLLGELGARVVALDVRPVRVAAVEVIALDLGDPGSIAAAAHRVGEPVDALMNCAGVPGPPLSALTTMLVNFVGPRELTERLLPRMKPGSAVASVSSLAGLGWPKRLPKIRELLATGSFEAARAWCEANPDVVNGYQLAKECLIVWTLARAKELGPRGIRMNVTSPGITDTPMLPSFHAMVGREWMETHLQGFLGRNARPDEQAWPLLFLCSEAASFVTGANLIVDGGHAGALAVGAIEPTPPPPVAR